jgi:hypothetical protein
VTFLKFFLNLKRKTTYKEPENAQSDLAFQGSKFTWFNNRTDHNFNFTKERLDRTKKII